MFTFFVCSGHRHIFVHYLNMHNEWYNVTYTRLFEILILLSCFLLLLIQKHLRNAYKTKSLQCSHRFSWQIRLTLNIQYTKINIFLSAVRLIHCTHAMKEDSTISVSIHKFHQDDRFYIQDEVFSSTIIL